MTAVYLGAGFGGKTLLLDEGRLSGIERAFLRALVSVYFRMDCVGYQACGAWRRLDLLYGITEADIDAAWASVHGPTTPMGWLQTKSGLGAMPTLERSRSAENDPRVSKIGPGTRFGSAPDDQEWNEPMVPPRDDRGRDRLQRLERWELIGDHAAALYKVVAAKVPPTRRRSGRFNKDAAVLVADVLNHQYSQMLSRLLTWEDVKSRLQARA